MLSFKTRFNSSGTPDMLFRLFRARRKRLISGSAGSGAVKSVIGNRLSLSSSVSLVGCEVCDRCPFVISDFVVRNVAADITARTSNKMFRRILRTSLA